jgi:hypothetical protein
MLKRVRRAATVIVGLYPCFKVLCQSNVVAIVDSAKDINVAHLFHHSTRIARLSIPSWLACPEKNRRAVLRKTEGP